MKKAIVASILSLMPVLALAQTSVVIKDVNSLSDKLTDIGNVVIYILVSLAVIFIIWNVVMALIRGSDPEAKSAALKNVGYGVLGLAIILSIWGLVNIITGTFRTTPPPTTTPTIPGAPEVR